MRHSSALLALLALLTLLATPATAQAPLSAIDWLGGGNAAAGTDLPGKTDGTHRAGRSRDPEFRPGTDPRGAPDALHRSVPKGDAGAGTAAGSVPSLIAPPEITVQPIGEARPDGAGLIPPDRAGLPADPWHGSRMADVARALAKLPADSLPALRALAHTLLLTEAAPPADAAPGAFLALRLDELRRMGLVEAALALAERAGAESPPLLARQLDLALLTGTEGPICGRIAAAPWLSPDPATRIFCLARTGDWQAAALIHRGAAALNLLPPRQRTLLAAFLDPASPDASPLPQPPAPAAMTPLVFRLYEAAGAPLPTRALPRAFAVADLRGNSGWKAELEAAERLARVGALSGLRLLGLYTARQPAASGGVWRRVEMVQKLDSALRDGDTAALDALLPAYWRTAKAQGLAEVWARMLAGRLAGRQPGGPAACAALEMALLTPEYESAARRVVPRDAAAGVLVSVALGRPRDLAPAGPPEGLRAALRAGFDRAPPDAAGRRLLAQGRVGEALLNAARRLHRANRRDGDDITTALRLFRAAGQEDLARRAALQLLILAPREG